MPAGLLELTGTIDLAQFWPSGESDADTVKVLVSGPNAFRFTPHGGNPKVTHAFEGAQIKGKVSKPAIDQVGRVTIRLQGIDAPELHYRPTAPTLGGQKPNAVQRAAFNTANGNFRQPIGEGATVALGKFLATFGKSPLKAVVRTQVDQPNDVFDMFGRMIGDIFVNPTTTNVNVNHWLCQKGWAYPTFYSSMTTQEISDLLALTAAAAKSKLGIWNSNSANLASFDRNLLFRPHGVPDAAHDVGPVFMPKLFRRRSTYGIAKVAKITTATLKNYLKGEPDACFTTQEFLLHGPTSSTPRHLDEFVTPDARFTVGAGDLVFQEGKSHVVGKNGKPVSW